MKNPRAILTSGILAALGAATSPALAQTGACCVQNGTCSVQTSADCTTALGVYVGDATTCPASGLCYAEIEGNDDLALALANQTTRAVVLTGGDRLVGRTTGTSGTGGGSTSPDYWIVQTAVQATPGIWRHTLQLETGFTGATWAFLGGLQGATQAGGVANPISGNGATLQAISANAAFRPVAWYGFGKQETVILKLTGTTATTGAYNYRLVDAPVTPITATGTIYSGALTIRVINTPDATFPGTMDAEAWLYDSNFNPLTNGAQGPGGADGLLATGDPADTRTSFIRTLAPGVYYLAVSPTNLANDQPNDALESSVKNIAAYPNMILCDRMFQNNMTTQKYTATVQLADGSGNVVNSDAALTWVPTWSANVHFVQFTVLPAPSGECCIAGACTVTLQADCTGAWTVGGTCSPGPCAAPNGSCCNIGACSITAQANCAGNWTLGSVCNPNPCPARCCAPNGGCTLVAQASCTGTWTSAGTVCDPNPCPQPVGVCCNNATGDCTLSYSGSCASGATFNGGTTVCDVSACPATGACCSAADGSCSLIYGGSCPAGTSTGVGTVCDASACPVTGVCCNNNTGACTFRFGTSCAAGYTDGGSMVCEASTCTIVHGACCTPTTGTCTVVPSSACTSGGGLWLGLGTACPAGACYAEVEPNSRTFADYVNNPATLNSGDVISGIATGGGFDPAGAPGTNAAVDFWLITTSAQPLGIYRHEMTQIQGTAGWGVRGRGQNNGALADGNTGVQGSAGAANMWKTAWYGFGKQEEVILEPFNGSSTPYVYQLTDTPVTPAVAPGNLAPGAVTIRVIDGGITGSVIDSDCWLYDAGFNALVNDPLDGPGGADGLLAAGDPAGTTTSFTRTLAAGAYYLAVSPVNLANNQPNDAIEGIVSSASNPKYTLYFPDAVLCSVMNGATSYTATVQITDSVGNSIVSPELAWTATWRGDVQFVQFTVGASNGACCRGTTCSVDTAANCVGANSSYKGDGTVCNLPGNNTTPCCRADYNQSGSVTVQDIFDFLGGYFTVNPIADINQSGAVTVQDIFDFLSAYFTGCI